jgi:hypothetical protein
VDREDLEMMREARRNGETITAHDARKIASWYQSPGRDGIGFAQFASTGTLPPRRDMERAISREQRDAGPIERGALAALRHYIRNPHLRPDAL